MLKRSRSEDSSDNLSRNPQRQRQHVQRVSLQAGTSEVVGLVKLQKSSLTSITHSRKLEKKTWHITIV